jgi:hypothetical protein
VTHNRSGCQLWDSTTPISLHINEHDAVLLISSDCATRIFLSSDPPPTTDGILWSNLPFNFILPTEATWYIVPQERWDDLITNTPTLVRFSLTHDHSAKMLGVPQFLVCEHISLSLLVTTARDNFGIWGLDCYTDMQ